MTAINETRKEDDTYFCGGFWIIADSLKDIFTGNFILECIKIPCDYNGDYISEISSKRELAHKQYWNRYLIDRYGVEYNYYPRGRVSVHNGVAYINICDKMNIPKVIDTVIKEYHLQKLDIDVEIQENKPGDFYGFTLR